MFHLYFLVFCKQKSSDYNIFLGGPFFSLFDNNIKENKTYVKSVQLGMALSLASKSLNYR